MTLKVGYGKKYLDENIRAYMDESGFDEERARRAAKNLGRKAFKKKFKHEDYPDYLVEGQDDR